MQKRLLAGLLLVVMGFNLGDLLLDLRQGMPALHVISEALIALVSGLGAGWLLWQARRRARELTALRQSLARTDQALQHMTAEVRRMRHAYSATIQQQFEQWGLTASEQQVALMLLKGLSLKDIAALRDTREKTVRQQTSAIYAKAGLAGRHEFAAWFFEDFL